MNQYEELRNQYELLNGKNSEGVIEGAEAFDLIFHLYLDDLSSDLGIESSQKLGQVLKQSIAEGLNWESVKLLIKENL